MNPTIAALRAVGAEATDDPAALVEAATLIFDGLYAVDESGRVFSLTAWRGQRVRLMEPTLDDDGYQRVRLTVDGRRFNAAVHRLVCATFHGPKPSVLHEVRHLNGDKMDNRAANLAWGTKADNAADRERHGRTARGERNGMASLTDEQVAAIRRAYDAGESKQYQLAAVYGVDETTIGHIVRREYRAGPRTGGPR